MHTLDKIIKYQYNILAIGVWRSLVSRLVRVQEASGSNPDTPTSKNSRFWNVKVLKTVIFIEYSSILTQINPPAFRGKSDPKTVFDPDLTQTGTVS